MITNYKTLTAPTYQELDTKVREHLDAGWSLHGPQRDDSDKEEMHYIIVQVVVFDDPEIDYVEMHREMSA